MSGQQKAVVYCTALVCVALVLVVLIAEAYTGSCAG